MSQNHQENPMHVGKPSNEISIQCHHHTCAHIVRELNMHAQIPKTRREKKNIELEYISFLKLNVYTKIEVQATQNRKG